MAKRVSLPDSISSSSVSVSPYKKRKPTSPPLPPLISDSPSSALSRDHLKQKHKSLETEAISISSASASATACILSLSEGQEGSKMDSGGNNNGRNVRAGGNGRRMVVMPPQSEIDEFFSAAEKYEQKRFTDKYNYDVVKDTPLEGRYQWVRFNP